MDYLDEQTKIKLQEIHSREQKKAQQFLQIEEMVKQFLSKEARERYGNIRIAHPEKAMRLLSVISQMISKGHITAAISDDQLREILQRLEPEKHAFRIKRA